MSSETDPLPRPSKAPLILIFSVTLIILSGWAAFGINQLGAPFNATLPNLGLFGDMFGCLNALFSAVAMTFGFYALRIQNWQIQDQQRQINAEKKNAEEMFRREKLREFLDSMSEFKDLVMSSTLKFLENPSMNDYQWWPIGNGMMSRHSEVTTLVQLYFANDAAKMLPSGPNKNVIPIVDKVRRSITANTLVADSDLPKAMLAFHDYVDEITLRVHEVILDLESIVKNHSASSKN